MAESKTKKQDNLKWGALEVIRFLGVYRKYEELWNTNNAQFMKRNAREDAFKKLYEELIEFGFVIATYDHLKRKIKNLKDAYRIEINKVKKSMKSGVGTDDIYVPKLVWFREASFLKSILSGRESSSNLDLSRNESLEEDDRGFNESAENSLQSHDDDSSDPLSSTKSKEKKKLMTKYAEPRPSAEPPKKISKTSASSFKDSVSQLQDIARMSTVQEDEYERFALHIAAQLRKLPERSFVLLQGKIQNLITQERLRYIVSPSDDNEPSNSYGTPPPHSLYITGSLVSHEEPSDQGIFIIPDQQANFVMSEAQPDKSNAMSSTTSNNYGTRNVAASRNEKNKKEIQTLDNLEIAIESIKDCFD